MVSDIKGHIDMENMQELMNMARIGSWHADFGRRKFICSKFVSDLLGMQDFEISFGDFMQLVREDHRARVENELEGIRKKRSFDQKFPLLSPDGCVWVHAKLCFDVQDVLPDIASGFVQCIDKEEERDINYLLHYQNSISRSLLTLLQAKNISDVIPDILTDILEYFNGDRVYIFEFDKQACTHSNIYEVTADGVSQEIDLLKDVPFEESKWWTGELLAKRPVVMYSLDEMPAVAASERLILEAQDIKSIMVVPLVSHEDVWGYLGIDIVDRHRHWSDEDYQWFASLANIISICVELRKSEREAIAEKEYLDRLYRYMPIGFLRTKLIYDDDGELVDYIPIDVNKAAEKITGYSYEEFVGRQASTLNVNLEHQLEVFGHVLESGGYSEFYTTIGKNNKYVHVILYLFNRDELVVLFSDMTDSFEAHEALDRSEKILRNIYKNLPAGIELYDADGVLVDMNDKELEIFGLNDKQDALGVNLFDNPNIPDIVKLKLRNKEMADFSINYDFSKTDPYYHSRNNGIINLVVKATPLYDSQDRLINYLFINIDTTETTSVYSRLQEFEDFFSLIADFAKVGYFKWNPLRDEGFALNQWFKNLNEPENKPLSQIAGVYETLHPEDREELIAFYNQALAGQAKYMCKEIRVAQDDGSWKWLRCHLMVREYDPDDRNVEMLSINFDITELKRAEEKLIIARDKAEALDRLKSAFLANMSHEIRTPLNAIVGFSNLLTETDDLNERRQYMSIVQENNELLLQLISDILDLSKIEAGTFEFVNNYLDVNQLCAEIVCSMKMKSGSGVSILFEQGLPECYLYSDKNRIMQVITNFINNAVKFTSDGSITLGYEIVDNCRIRFYVRDTGIGISREKVGSVFERFVKLNSFVQGTGLGLSICKSIVEQMDGEIGVESEEGKGSCFWFMLPYTASNSCEVNTGSREDGVAVTDVTAYDRKPLILIAEDTDSNYKLISTVLAKEGYAVERAEDGVEVVAKFHQLHPDMILMDMKMPNKDGIEATMEIRTVDNRVPILALTAFAFDQDRQRTINAGCNDYIAKPISVAALKQTIEKWMQAD